MDYNYYLYRSGGPDVAFMTSSYGYSIDHIETYTRTVKYYMARYDLLFDINSVKFYPSHDYCMVDYTYEE